MKTLNDIPHLEGVRVLLRADFNVPVRNGTVADPFRIASTLPTIDFLVRKGAKLVIVSHLESIDGGNDSLLPIAQELARLGRPVTFIRDWKQARGTIEGMPDGSCLLLENIRLFEGEKKNDPAFAAELASLADIYVNDAFSVSHREHASIVGVPKLLPSYAGFQLEKEISSLSRAFAPEHPFLFILGGAKFETKLPLLTRFLELADRIFVGGALANDIYRARGYETGRSLLSKGAMDLSAFAADTKVLVPEDIVDQNGAVKAANAVGREDKIMDSGPATIAVLGDLIKTVKFILWNGPLGVYEDGYRQPTLELARRIGEATLAGAETIVGGGDTLAAIAELGIPEKFTFISTGGGAMLDFLAQGTLAGIEALEHSQA